MLHMPIHIFLDAIRAAETIPYEEGSPYHGVMAGCENHPAMKILTDWWNANAPALELRCAGIAMTWVAPHRDATIYSVPTNTLPDMEFKRDVDYADVARVGDKVLLTFIKSQHDLNPSEGDGCPIFRTVNGDIWSAICESNEDIYSGEHDEALDPLEALAAFRYRCEGTWYDLVMSEPKAAV